MKLQLPGRGHSLNALGNNSTSMQPAELFLFLTFLSHRIGHRMGPLMQNNYIYLTQADKPTGELPRWGWHRQGLDRTGPSRSRRCWQSRLK